MTQEMINNPMSGFTSTNDRRANMSKMTQEYTILNADELQDMKNSPMINKFKH